MVPENLKSKFTKKELKEFATEVPLTEAGASWLDFENRFQRFPYDIPVKLTYLRGEKVQSAEINLEPTTTYHASPVAGISIVFNETHVASQKAGGKALRLGCGKPRKKIPAASR